MQDKRFRFPVSDFIRPALTGAILFSLTLFSFLPMAAHADAAGDKKRAQLAGVKRVLVVPPYFGTESALEALKPGAEEKTDAKGEPGAKGSEKTASETENAKTVSEAKDEASRRDRGKNTAEARATYFRYLSKLQNRARTYLPERIVARTPFAVLPADDFTAAMKALKLTPQQLFLTNGQIRGSKYPLPDPEAIKKLASRLEADAVVIGILDEPRRDKGGYTFDPLSGPVYDSPNVRSRAGFFVLSPDGTEILHDYIEVLHPLTRLGNREFLLADWSESQDLVIENLLDEWTRYTPPLPNPRAAKTIPVQEP